MKEAEDEGTSAENTYVAVCGLHVRGLPLASFGGVTASIPAPPGIGKVELADSEEVSGYICERYTAGSAEDITAYGGLRSFLSRS